MDIKTGVINRLSAFGYTATPEDDYILGFIVDKVKQYILNTCNICRVPKGLYYFAVDRAVGEFLLSKKAADPDSLTNIDLTAAEKQIKMGDTSVTFGIGAGDGSKSAEQRLDEFIYWLKNWGLNQLGRYRRIRW